MQKYNKIGLSVSGLWRHIDVYENGRITRQLYRFAHTRQCANLKREYIWEVQHTCQTNILFWIMFSRREEYANTYFLAKTNWNLRHRYLILATIENEKMPETELFSRWFLGITIRRMVIPGMTMRPGRYLTHTDFYSIDECLLTSMKSILFLS